MNAEQRIQWVAAPSGVAADGSLRLSVLVAPRLRSEQATLAPFPDFHDWPACIRAAGFEVKIDDRLVPATVVSEPPNAADSALWKALFGPATPLQPFVFDDLADRPLVSYSVAALAEHLRDIYSTAAFGSPAALPHLSFQRTDRQGGSLASLLGPLNTVQEMLKPGAGGSPAERIAAMRARTAVARAQPGRKGLDFPLEPLPAPGDNADRGTHFARALLFHSRSQPDPVAMPADGAQAAAAIDFHQMLGALGEHPWLMRRLGLVIDLKLDPQALPPPMTRTAATHVLLSVKPTWPSSPDGPKPIELLPATSCMTVSLSGERRFSASRRLPPQNAAPESLPGMLMLPASAFALEQVDIDGAVLKTLNLHANVFAGLETVDPDARGGLPALRSSGISLAEAGKAGALQARFARQLEVNGGLENNAAATLYAEDLLRGYRLDVFDAQAKAWRSLHKRSVTASVAGFAGPVQQDADEGFVQLGLAGPPVAHGAAPDPNAELYVHETLATWDGWSLSAPRPGKALSSDPRAPRPDAPETQPARVANTAFGALGLSFESKVAAGSLPRLRFGRSYRLRVRTVDLAGNGPSLEEADQLVAAPQNAAYVLPAEGAMPYLRFEPVPAPVLVPAQHFGEGASLNRLVIRSNAGVPAPAYAAAFNQSEPVTAGRRRGYAEHDVRHLAAPKGALEMAERHGMFDQAVGAGPEAGAAIAAAYEIARREKGSFDDTALPDTEAVVLQTGSAAPQRYVIHRAAELALPYLPDPLAAGVVLFDLPGQPPAEPLRIGFDAPQWQAPRSLRLRLAEGSGPPAWDAAARVLTLHLPPAATATIRVCSLLAGDPEQMGMLAWCRGKLPDIGPVLQAAKENRMWLLTPWHEITLVHAVQQPLVVPKCVAIEVERAPLQTHADLVGQIALDRASTEKIELVARWTEQVDDPAQEAPATRSCASSVFELSLAQAERGQADVAPRETAFSLRESALLTFSTALAPRLQPPLPMRHEFGDTRYRKVGYEVLAATRFREYFPVELAGHPELLAQKSEAQVRIVPSTAAPAPPQVLYVVPTFGWESGGEGPTVLRRRRGGGLRVYLARPWFSSGDGERLGVVVGAEGSSPERPDYPFVTLLGRDPTRAGPWLDPAAVTLRNAATVVPGIRVNEIADPVTIIACDPVYDKETRRWFCDLELGAGDAYFEFVRLALVRYQEHSMAGFACSPIVLADIVQTVPDRALTVTRGEQSLQVTLAGVSYAAIAGPAGQVVEPALARVTARLERRDPAIPDAALGWTAIEGSELVLSRSTSGATTTWSGTFAQPPADGAPRRLVVREEEFLAGDEQSGSEGGLCRRLIYTDTLEL